MTLKDKFQGCIACTWVGSAMGAAVEGWSFEEIEKHHGRLNKLLPYEHYNNGWQRPPGTTEDGIERQKLIATAIIEKQDRINAADLVAVWKRDLDPEKVVFKQEKFDVYLCELAHAGCPHTMLGNMWPFPNVISVARASHPLGLINAGDPEGAAGDSFDIGRLYNYDNVPALRWAALYNAGIAAACAPDATVTSVIATIRAYVNFRKEAAGLYAYDYYDRIESEVDRAIELAESCEDYAALRDEFYKHYDGGRYVVYGLSQANEIVAKGIALFVFSNGDPEATIVNAVNFGRDTDCVAAIAGGLAGALSGGATVRREWVDQVNEATRQDPYTNNKRTIEETAEGLYEAFMVRRARIQSYLDAMSDPAFLSA